MHPVFRPGLTRTAARDRQRVGGPCPGLREQWAKTVVTDRVETWPDVGQIIVDLLADLPALHAINCWRKQRVRLRRSGNDERSADFAHVFRGVFLAAGGKGETEKKRPLSSHGGESTAVVSVWKALPYVLIENRQFADKELTLTRSLSGPNVNGRCQAASMEAEKDAEFIVD